MSDDSSPIPISEGEAPLGASFSVKEETVRIGTRELTLLRPSDVDALIDAITPEEFAVDERFPYWAELWHSAIALAEFVDRHASLVAGRGVVELGCGLGLPGIIASLHGARVDFTDYEPQALRAAEMNLRRIHPTADATFSLLDFRTPPDRTWPVVLAADIIYERRFIDPLVHCLTRILGPGGCIVLAEPNRQVAEPFFEAMHVHGFVADLHRQSATLDGRIVDIGIRVYRRDTAPSVLAIEGRTP